MARHSGGRHNHYNDVGFSRGYINPSRTLKELREMGEHVARAALAELKKGADVVVADAKSRCPVKTGRLRDSIKAESNREGSAYWLTANASTESPKSPTGRFYYGPVVEFDPRINKPFMYPALDAHKQEIRDNINAAVNRAIRSG